MSDDLLSTVLQSVRIAGSLQFCVMTSGTWQTDGVPRLARSGPAGSRNVPVHVIAEGSCWLKMEGRLEYLSAGDVLAFPFGTGHALGVGEDGPTITPMLDLPPRPWRDIPVLRYGSGAVSARIMCGYVTLDALNFGPLRQALPALLKAGSQEPEAEPLLRAAVQQMVREADRQAAGSQAVLQRLTEIIIIELLRHEMHAQRNSASGLLCAMLDAVLGRCLSGVHTDPSRQWSVVDLARMSGVSRSVLEERFQSVLATSPMKYVREWRLYLASVALRNGKRPISQIAGEAGYGTEAAFNRAFARAHGMPPARFRAASLSAA